MQMLCLCIRSNTTSVWPDIHLRGEENVPDGRQETQHQDDALPQPQGAVGLHQGQSQGAGHPGPGPGPGPGRWSWSGSCFYF